MRGLPMGEKEMYGPSIKPEERTWAMIAHLGGIAGLIVGVGQLGWVVPLVLWFVYREKSSFVAFHALQQLLFQLACLAAFWIAVGVVTVLTFLVIGVFLWPLVALIPVVPFIWSIVAALKANVGEWYEYPVVGTLARRYTLPV